MKNENLIKIIVETLKENEAGLINKNNYIKAVKSDYYLQVAESIVEKLPIYVIMQQRELLSRFLKYYNQDDLTVSDEIDIDLFLNINN